MSKVRDMCDALVATGREIAGLEHRLGEARHEAYKAQAEYRRELAAVREHGTSLYEALHAEHSKLRAELALHTSKSATQLVLDALTAQGKTAKFQREISSVTREGYADRETEGWTYDGDRDGHSAVHLIRALDVLAPTGPTGDV